VSDSASQRFPTSPPGTLEVVEARTDDAVCLTVVGEVDLGTAPRLPEHVGEALQSGARNVCIDLTGVSFIDSSGLAALVSCHRNVAGANGRMTVVHNGGEVLRLFELSALERALDLHTSRDAALAVFASDATSSDGAVPSS
jgi:anti-sigma B factor antagonist